MCAEKILFADISVNYVTSTNFSAPWVSSGKDAMLHSLEAQVSYYSGLIQNHSGWEYAGVYADEARTGTKDTRENFVRLLADCRAGKIEIKLAYLIQRTGIKYRGNRRNKGLSAHWA